MNLKTKSNIEFNYIDVHLHSKCIIVLIKNKNSLYEFKDCDKMISDLSKFIELKDLKHLKEFLEHNSTKIKFTKIKEDTDQLNLFN